MPHLAADENFNGDIVRGLLRQNPALDIVRVQDVGLSGFDDPSLLQWCGENHRVLLTHDVRTMIGHAYARVKQSEPMPGIVVVSQDLAIGEVIAEIQLFAQCSHDGE